MSNFLRKGKRISSNEQKKSVKRHTKAFYKILGKMNKLAMELIVHEEDVTEDNIQQLAVDYIGRELDRMEQMMVLSKLKHYKEAKEIKDEVHNR